MSTTEFIHGKYFRSVFYANTNKYRQSTILYKFFFRLLSTQIIEKTIERRRVNITKESKEFINPFKASF